MTFDPDKYLQNKGIPVEDTDPKDIKSFDPDKYLQKKEPTLASEPTENLASKLSTITSNLAQGMSFGLSDEVAGGVEALGELGGLQGLGGDLAEIGISQDDRPLSMQKLIEAYRRGRDTERGLLEKTQTDNPKLATTMDIAGGFLAPLPGANLIKGGKAIGAAEKGLATLGEKAVLEAGEQGVKQAAMGATKAGAIAGGLEGYGRTDSEDTLDQFLNTIGGAGLGAGVGKVVDRLGARNSKEALKQTLKDAPLAANQEALKAIGANAADFAQEIGTANATRATAKTAKGTGQTLIDEGVLKGRQTIDKLKEDLVTKLDDVYNKQMVPTIQKLDTESAQIPIEKIKGPFEDYTNAMRRSMEGMVGNSKYAEEASGVIYQNMVKTSKMVYDDVVDALKSPNKFDSLNKIKQKLQSEVNWKNQGASNYNEFLISMQSDVSRLMNDLAQKVSPELGEQMVKNNKTYANLLRANEISGRELTKSMAKGDKIGLGEYVAAGVISGVTDNKLLGPASIAAKRLVEKYGGKDLSKLMATHSAFRADKSAKRAKEILENLEDSPFRRTFMDVFDGKAPSVAKAASNASAAVLSGTDASAPYEKNRQTADYVKKASPEQLKVQANDIRSKYGKSGERLASTLDLISEKDKIGREALVFSILQSPDNRKMLGLTDNEE